MPLNKKGRCVRGFAENEVEGGRFDQETLFLLPLGNLSLVSGSKLCVPIDERGETR